MVNGLARNLLGRPVVQVAVLYALAGAGFAGANLIFAWILTAQEYGLVALVIALTNIGVGIGPLGLNAVVNRHSLKADRRLFEHGLAAATLCAAAIGLFGYVAYDLSGLIWLAMTVAILAGGMAVLAASRFQADQRFVLAACLAQIGNLGLAVTSVIVLIVDINTPLLPLLLMAATFLIAAAWSWPYLFRRREPKSRQVRLTDWSDAISIAGIVAAVEIQVQLERVLAPHLLSLEALAAFGVMAAIVVSPYRALELAVGYTLLPRLRATTGPLRRRRVLGNEIVLIGSICVGGGLVIWIVTPPVVEWLYSGKFDVSAALVTAGIVSATIKVAASLARAAAEAYCDTKELWRLTWFSWVAVAFGGLGAYYGSQWGLPGLVYGASLGYAARIVFTSWIAARYYRAGPAKEPLNPRDLTPLPKPKPDYGS